MSRFSSKVSRNQGQKDGTGLARAIGNRDIVPSRFLSRFPLEVSRLLSRGVL